MADGLKRMLDAFVVTHTDMTPYPKLAAWYSKIQERPVFRKMRLVALPNGLIGVP